MLPPPTVVSSQAYWQLCSLLLCALWLLLSAGCAASPVLELPTPTAAPATVTPTSLPAPSPSPLVLATTNNNPTDGVTSGVEVYKRAYCGACHTFGVVGALGTFAPTHNNMAATAAARLQAANYLGAATTPAEYLRESILEPARYIVDGYGATRHPMPAYTYLSAAEVDALISLLLQG